MLPEDRLHAIMGGDRWREFGGEFVSSYRTVCRLMGAPADHTAHIDHVRLYWPNDKLVNIHKRNGSLSS